MGVAAAIGAAVIIAGTTVYTSEEQKRQARLNRDQQTNEITRQKKELATRQNTEMSTAKRDQEKARKQALAASAGGRQGTILTSPIGIVEDSNNKPKNVLGG